MKINKAELQIALEKVKPGLANKDLIEQATSFAFMGNRVVTYNDEISISHPVKGLEKVEGAIKAQALYEFLNKVKKDEITLEWKDNQVIISAGRSKAGLVFEQEVKLPIEEIGEIGKWKKLPEGFVEALKLCYPCCSRDMSRPVLTCVHVKGNYVEASDSYQIIRHKLKGDIPGKNFMIPATSVKELIKYGISEMSQGESWIHFRTEDKSTIFSARMVEGVFPDVGQYLEVEGEEFNFPESTREALEKANIFANKSASMDIPIVNIEVSGGFLKLSAKNEYGWFEEKARVKSKEAKFAFTMGIAFLINLLDKLQVCKIEPGKIGFSGENWKHVVATLSNEEEE